MEQPRHGKQPQRRRSVKNEKKRKRASFLIWAVLVVIFAGGAVFLSAFFHEDTKEKVQKSVYPLEYTDLVEKAAADYDLDPNLIYAVIHTESGFNPNAESGAGARGLMQVMPDTFEWLSGIRGEGDRYTADDLYTPSVCIDYGCYLLRYNLDLFSQDEVSAVAAYNAGFGKVEEWLSDSTLSSDGKKLDQPENIPIDETRDYVSKVENAKRMYTELYGSK